MAPRVSVTSGKGEPARWGCCVTDEMTFPFSSTTAALRRRVEKSSARIFIDDFSLSIRGDFETQNAICDVVHVCGFQTFEPFDQRDAFLLLEKIFQTGRKDRSFGFKTVEVDVINR